MTQADGDSRPLDFDRDIEIPDTLDRRIEVFLNRWQWRGSRDVVQRELYQLIAWAVERHKP